MKVLALFILSTIYLVECYRISVTSRNSNALVDIRESDQSSDAAVKELLSKLSLNNSNAKVAEGFRDPTNEANSLPSANFEENPTINTKKGSQSNIVNNLEDAKSPVFSFSQIPEMQQPSKESSLSHSAFTSAAENEENQNEGTDINKNEPLLQPQNQTDSLSASSENKNQNLSTPIFTYMLSIQSDLSTVNSQSQLISNYEANSKLPQPIHSSSSSINLPDPPQPSSSTNQDLAVLMPLLTTNQNHVKLLISPNNVPVQSGLFIENSLSPQNSTYSTTNLKLPQPPQFQGSTTNLPVPPQFSSSANQNSAAPISPLFSINLNHNRPKPPASTNNVPVQSVLLTVNTQNQLNSTSATNLKFPQPPSFSANHPAPPQSMSFTKHRPTPPSTSTLNRPVPPAGVYARTFKYS